ncbi:MAG: hypothetical protein ACPGVB_17340 [Chitinophagales bacterium]
MIIRLVASLNFSKQIVILHGELYYLPFDVLLNQHQITDAENFEKLPYNIVYSLFKVPKR